MNNTNYLYNFKPIDLAEAIDAYLRLPINFNTTTFKPILFDTPGLKDQSQILTHLIKTYGPPLKLR